MDTPIGIHLDPDGTVRIVTDSAVTRLRRPTLAEYTDLVDAVLDADYAVIGTRPRLVALNKKVGDGTATGDDIAEARGINRQVQTAKVDVVVRAIDMLGDTSIARANLPVWLAAGAADVITGLFGHWETVPFHGSGQNGT